MDEADNAQVDIELEEKRRKKYYEEQARKIPKGEPGECIRCGEESLRLVNQVCARCRDKYKLT